ncbi:MAG: 7-carboxy-7-deazaguanine synthase QueE [Deltaproteobacteria bacterium]|nr:MAG: 7-carboxy-7-deazaguanine synthase QueE [Deltaproteobacteria bacterium]
MTDTLNITEIFCSIQGEGALTGVPSVFVRTSGCNLRCRWCDTPYSSWEPEGEPWTVDAIVAEVARHAPVRHVVLTGGEPLVAKHLGALAERLHDAGYHLTVETAGTVFQPLPVDLWSISPKLADSTPRPEDGAGAWRERHEATRYRPDVIRRMMAAGDYQLKVVVTAPEDLDEVLALVADVGATPERVLLMPQGRTVEELDARARWLAPLCIAHGWRLCDRLHVRLFGDTRGT